MNHASLFSGIGGFDLAARWAGWENLFNCEIDPFCRTVLKHHFPDAEQYTDIRTAHLTVYRGLVDVLSGGFPCQPFSTAGKRQGTEDNRYLWPAMLGVIRDVRPRWVVGENVYGIVSWSDGLVFEQVCADLEAEGYEVGPYVLPACGVDAPHLRYRVWFVAHRADAGVENVRREGTNAVLSTGTTADADRDRCRKWPDEQKYVCRSCTAPDDSTRCASDTSSDRLQERHEVRASAICWTNPRFDRFPTKPPVCRGDDGLSERLDYDAVFAGIPKPRRAKAYNCWRKEAIKAYGNAVVPQVVYQLFQTINEYENL